MGVGLIPRYFLTIPRSSFFGKGRMHPLVHLSIVFWSLQCRSNMWSNSLVFHTSGGISSSHVAFLFLIFLSTESSSSYVNCPSLMSCWWLIIFGGLPRKFLKFCFHLCIRSSWLLAFSLTFVVLFLLLTLFIVCHAILDCLSSTESLMLLIWF